MSLCALTLCGCITTVTDGRARTAVRHYRDDGVSVTSPRVDARNTLDDRVTISAYWTADVITAATPTMADADVVSRATEYAETRHEAGLGLTVQRAIPREATLSHSVSVEPDYLASTTSARLAFDVLDRDATVGMTLAAGNDRVGATDVPTFDERRTSLRASFDWTHVLNRRALAAAAWDVERRSGYQASPYRLVPIGSGELDRPILVVPEQTPAARHRSAWEAMLLLGTTRGRFVRGAYRFYADDWAVRSHTVSLRGWLPLAGDRVRLGTRLRGYRQTAADFYASRYETLPRHRTGDVKLSPFSSLTAGARVDLQSPAESEGITMTLSYDAVLFSYRDYAPDAFEIAHLLGITLEVDYR